MKRARIEIQFALTEPFCYFGGSDDLTRSVADNQEQLLLILISIRYNLLVVKHFRETGTQIIQMGLNPVRLQSLRNQRGLSQRELARLSGLGETQIHKYENGQSDPSSTNLSLIADQLNVSSDYLLGRTDVPNGYAGDGTLSDEERTIIETFRRERWSGIARLSVEKLSDQ